MDIIRISVSRPAHIGIEITEIAEVVGGGHTPAPSHLASGFLGARSLVISVFSHGPTLLRTATTARSSLRRTFGVTSGAVSWRGRSAPTADSFAIPARPMSAPSRPVWIVLYRDRPRNRLTVGSPVCEHLQP